MAVTNILDGFQAVLHRVKVRLFPNYLPGIPGAYIARTSTERVLSIEDVLAAMRDRGGYKGDLDQLYEGIKRYYSEMVYQICDGYSVNTGLYKISVAIGGTFSSPNEAPDPARNPILFRMFPQALLREQARNITLDIEGLAPSDSWLDEIVDVSSGAVNESLSVGKNFQLRGSKIKVAGDPGTGYGVFFVPTEGEGEVLVTEKLVDNQTNYVAGIIPSLNPSQTWRVEIRTFYSGGKLLKTMRTLKLAKDLTVNQ